MRKRAFAEFTVGFAVPGMRAGHSVACDTISRRPALQAAPFFSPKRRVILVDVSSARGSGRSRWRVSRRTRAKVLRMSVSMLGTYLNVGSSKDFTWPPPANSSDEDIRFFGAG